METGAGGGTKKKKDSKKKRRKKKKIARMNKPLELTLNSQVKTTLMAIL